MTAQSSALFPQHRALLDASAIDPDIARERQYRSVDTLVHLKSIGIVKAGRSVPGLLIPTCGMSGVVGFQYRPDTPRLGGNGKPIKYETPWKQPNRLDVHPRCRKHLGDPKVPLIVTEGARKVDALITARAECVIGLTGVWNWRGTNGAGGKVALPDWQDVALNGRQVLVGFDHDAMSNPKVQGAARALGAWLQFKGATVGFLWVPRVGDDEHTGIDDWLAAGGTLPELLATRTDMLDNSAALPSLAETGHGVGTSPPPAKVTLTEAHEVARRWLGNSYDLDALDVALATVAVERLDGDPLWALLVSGSGNAKTETVMAVSEGAVLVSNITSAG
ncbi:MAG: DUF3854 domain-containing protein, partial [Candidatus Nanopelagicales bacterium]